MKFADYFRCFIPTSTLDSLYGRWPSKKVMEAYKSFFRPDRMALECKGKMEPNYKTHPSSRYESQP